MAEPTNQLGGWARTQPHLLGSPAGRTDSAVEGIPTSSVISALKSAPRRTASSGPYWSKKQPSLQHFGVMGPFDSLKKATGSLLQINDHRRKNTQHLGGSSIL